jgi:hypothetical protein
VQLPRSVASVAVLDSTILATLEPEKQSAADKASSAGTCAAAGVHDSTGTAAHKMFAKSNSQSATATEKTVEFKDAKPIGDEAAPFHACPDPNSRPSNADTKSLQSDVEGTLTDENNAGPGNPLANSHAQMPMTADGESLKCCYAVYLVLY